MESSNNVVMWSLQIDARNLEIIVISQYNLHFAFILHSTLCSATMNVLIIWLISFPMVDHVGHIHSHTVSWHH